MAEVEIHFRDYSKETGRTLNATVHEAAIRGFLGAPNAGRLLSFGGHVLSADNFNLLDEISSGEGPEQHVGDIAPVVRVAEDLLAETPIHPSETSNELTVPRTEMPIVHYHAPEEGGEWRFDHVWAVEYPGVRLDDEGEDVVGPRGAVVVRPSGKFMHVMKPEWPALVGNDLNRRLKPEHRKNLESTARVFTAHFGRFLFEMSYFDNESMKDERYRAAVRYVLRHYEMTQLRRLG